MSRKKLIPLSKPFFDHNERDEVSKVLDSGWVAGQGPAGERFSKQLNRFLGINYSIPVNNCTAGLHLALISLGIKKNDEVIVADYTYPATGHSVSYIGAKPVFCDINSSTFNIDPLSIPKLVSKKTKAIVVVHSFGNPAEMNKIIKIAKKYKLRVVEDCACALGSRYGKKFAGTIGDIGVFSFHARKGITTGEGGAIVTKNRKLYKIMKDYSCFGAVSAFNRSNSKKFMIPQFVDLGFNYKMSDINAAIGIAQLKKINFLSKKRNSLAKVYKKLLAGTPLIPQEITEGSFSVYQAFVCITPHRNKLVEYLKEQNIQCQIGTFSSCVQPVYKSKQKCVNSIAVFENAIALPLYYEMEKDDVLCVVNAIKEFFDER